ncbi:hypothetical protein ACFE04_013918 [Oxalis oulophora]
MEKLICRCRLSTISLANQDVDRGALIVSRLIAGPTSASDFGLSKNATETLSFCEFMATLCSMLCYVPLLTIDTKVRKTNISWHRSHNDINKRRFSRHFKNTSSS